MKLPENYHTGYCYWAQMMTLRCNGGCPYCILDRRGMHEPRTNELTGKQILDFWNSIEHRPLQRLSLIGGEPTLHPDLIDVINNLEGYAITVTTNCKNPVFQKKETIDKIKPKSSCTLRINTTFHPHHMTPEEYINAIKHLQDRDFFVDQTSYVLYPDFPPKHQIAVEKVAQKVNIYDSPYMGFWSKEKGFNAEPSFENNEMKTGYAGKSDPAKLCGITDYDAYKDRCAAVAPRHATCWHPMNALIIDPEGWYYPCHYRMYYKIEPICHIDDFRPATREDMECDYYGFCNWCDIPHGTCTKNPTAEAIT